MKIQIVTKKELSANLLHKLGEYLNKGFAIDSAEIWMKRFSYWWVGNPNISSNDTICWYLEDEISGTIKGFIGRIPILFQHGDDRFLASAGSSWYVDEDTRGSQSTRLFMKYCMEKNTQLYLDTTPTKPVQKSLPDMGFVRVGATMLTNYMSIANIGSFSCIIAVLSAHFSESETGALKRAFEIGSKFARITGKILPKAKEKKNQSILSSDSHNIRIVTCSEDFIEKLPQHLKGDMIEFSKDKTTLDWMFFSTEVQNLLHRTVAQIYSKTGKYLGYFIYDRQHVGTELLLRLRELQLLNPDDDAVKLIIAHLKQEAKIHGCAAVYSGLQRPDADVDKLLSKHILLKIKTEGRYYVKFRKNAIEGIENPYAIFVPSDLDPDVGFI